MNMISLIRDLFLLQANWGQKNARFHPLNQNGVADCAYNMFCHSNSKLRNKKRDKVVMINMFSFEWRIHDIG